MNSDILKKYTEEELQLLKSKWCSLHNHTGISNASRGFIDSSIKLENLVDYSMEKGLNGIALTDHESVGGFIQAEQLEKEKDFPILRGDEIYLVSDKQYEVLKSDYKSGMYFPHFLLVALDKTGNEMLRRLSTKAWVENSFWAGGLLRTPTKMSDLQMIIGQDKGHIVASTACLGGQLSKWIIDKIESPELAQQRDYFIQYFIQWCLEVFGENNFFLEMQPSDKYRYSTIVNDKDKRIEYEELLTVLKENPEFQYKKELEMQYVVNQELIRLSEQCNIPMIITTDTHYLKKEHLKLHSAFLNSSGGNDEDYSRNVEEIYRTTYVMSVEEILEYFKDYDKETIKQAIINTGDIVTRGQEYSLTQKQKVPKIKKCEGWNYKDCVGFFPNSGIYKDIMEQGHEDDKYLLYRLMLGMKQKPDVMNNLERSFVRLEEEIVEILAVSKQLEEHLGNYFTTMEKLIEIIWREGDSIVGAGRGSCASSLIAYCLEITQCNPLLAPVEMPFWRFITRERVELP